MNFPVKNQKVGSHKDFQILLHRYFREEASGLSEHTVKAKKQDLRLFLTCYLSICGSLDATLWDPFTTRYFIDELIKMRYSGATINRCLATVRSLGSWLRDQGVLEANPTKGIKELRLPDPTPRGVSDLAMARLKKSADALIRAPRSPWPQDFRNKVIMLSLESSAIRVNELLGLNLDQFDFQQKKFTNVRCKGGRIRDAKIKSEVADAIQEYIERHRVNSSHFIFTNRYGERLSRNGLAKSFKRILGVANSSLSEPAKIDNLRPHSLRHRAGHRARQLKDISWAAKKLGHASLRHVERYTTLDPAEEQRLTEEV
jgi:integrase/recombinase XerC